MKRIEKNRGTYIEQLVEKTITVINFQKLGFFERRYLPIQIIKKNKDLIYGKLLAKSYVDFHGLYKGLYIDFETKQVEGDNFNFSLLKSHQLEHMRLVTKLGGVSFLLICFFNHNRFFAITFSQLEKTLSKAKKVSLAQCEKNFYELKIVFPGILNLIEYLKK